MKKIALFLVMLQALMPITAGLVFAGGKQEAKPAESAGGSKAKSAEEGPLKAAILLSGPINDGGWNTSAYEGMKILESEMGYQIAYTENVKQPDRKNILQNYAKRDYDIIFGHGFEYGDALLDTAKEFPDTYFFNIGGIAQAENVGAATFAQGELSYLMGKLAAKFTKTDKVGFVGAMEIPSIENEVEVIKKTVKEYNPDASVTVAYTGSWTDVKKGKEAALAQIADGVDVMICIGDACDIGAIRAAEESGKAHVIGWSGDFNSIAPDVVLTSAVQSVKAMVEQVGKQVLNGSFINEARILGIKEGVQFPGTWSDSVPAELKAEIMADFEKIKSGEMEKRLD